MSEYVRPSEEQLQEFDRKIKRDLRRFTALKNIGFALLGINGAVQLLEITKIHDVPSDNLSAVGIAGLIGGISLLSSVSFWLSADTKRMQKQNAITEGRIADIKDEIERLERVQEQGIVIEGDYIVVSDGSAPHANINLDIPRLKG